MMEILCTMIYGNSSRYSNPAPLRTGGTPLTESIQLLYKVAEEFRAKNNIQVFTTIILTDGAGFSNKKISSIKHNIRNPRYGDWIIDAKTKIRAKINLDLDDALLKIYSKKFGSKVIGIYLTASPASWARDQVRKYKGKTVNLGNDVHVVASDNGYSRNYCMPAKIRALELREYQDHRNEDLVKEEEKFLKKNHKNFASTVFLRQFIEEIRV
jgi:hypothetical protein